MQIAQNKQVLGGEAGTILRRGAHIGHRLVIQRQRHQWRGGSWASSKALICTSSASVWVGPFRRARHTAKGDACRL